MAFDFEMRDGRKIIKNGEFVFSVTIPSRKREKLLLLSPFLPVANVYVHESEYESYAKALHGKEYGALHAHDSDTYYIWGQMNLYNPDEEDWFMNIDDDIGGLVNMFTRISSRSKIRYLPKLLEIFCQSGIIATELPTGLFGYSNTGSPRERKSYNPFSLRSWSPMGIAGILDRDLYGDPKIPTKTDIDHSLQVISKYKMLWRDNRYYFIFSKPDPLPGGASGQRTDKQADMDIQSLEEKWGSHVISPNGRQRGNGKTLTVTIPAKFDPKRGA